MSAKKKAKADNLKKLPSKKEMEKLRQEDSGFVLAQQDLVKFLRGRRQAVFNIARTYHLEPEELFQEGYEVLLTCIRDFTPVYQKANGDIISVQFTTFFGSRMDSRAMEMRNRDPEYQARQAYTSDMSSEERDRFRQDPPLLVQHLDQETSVQEALRGEVSMAREGRTGDVALKVAQDSFFDRKLNELVAKEQDEKKRAALMHVKVGGVFSFQEMAYHFGVTDSRASQILNDLMDAFYIQRLIDGNLESVAYDFKKLKFNEKRALRLIEEALKNSKKERQGQIIEEFSKDYPHVQSILGQAPAEPENELEEVPDDINPSPSHIVLEPFENGLSKKEEKQYAFVEEALWPVKELTSVDIVFRRAEEEPIPAYIEAMFEEDEFQYPLLINESGEVIDGQHRLAEAKRRGLRKVLCQVRRCPDEKMTKVLRVGVNIRLHNVDKLELYCAICALADLGLSQQKIADALGTSRTNVIVYTKVKDRAVPALRQLFEDGLIQITNASSCVDFSDKIQERIVSFIRTYGASWGKGAPFNELHQAASNSKLSQLEKKTAASQPVSVPAMPASPTVVDVTSVAEVSHLESKLRSYRQSLQDAEIWTAQRESVIARQTQELQDARVEIDALKKELEAAELTQFGDQSTVAEALKELKEFYNLSERVAGSLHHIKQVTRSVRNVHLTRKQLIEIQNLTDDLEQNVNALRVELATKAGVR